jgi:hypothetical protein
LGHKIKGPGLADGPGLPSSFQDRRRALNLNSFRIKKQFYFTVYGPVLGPSPGVDWLPSSTWNPGLWQWVRKVIRSLSLRIKDKLTLSPEVKAYLTTAQARDSAFRSSSSEVQLVEKRPEAFLSWPDQPFRETHSLAELNWVGNGPGCNLTWSPLTGRPRP